MPSSDFILLVVLNRELQDYYSVGFGIAYQHDVVVLNREVQVCSVARRGKAANNHKLDTRSTRGLLGRRHTSLWPGTWYRVWGCVCGCGSSCWLIIFVSVLHSLCVGSVFAWWCL